MLITSVLHILDRGGVDAKVSAKSSAEDFQAWLDGSLAQESQPEKPNERQNEETGSVKPPPADVVPPLILSHQRGMGELKRALEEVEKEERSPLLDVFE